MFASLILPVLAGCTDEVESQHTPQKTPVQAIFGDGPDTALVPFPSDRYTVADPSTRTGLRVDIGPHNTADALALSLPTIIFIPPYFASHLGIPLETVAAIFFSAMSFTTSSAPSKPKTFTWLALPALTRA